MHASEKQNAGKPAESEWAGMSQEAAAAKVADLQKQLDEANARTAEAEAKAAAIEEEMARVASAAPSPISMSGTVTADSTGQVPTKDAPA